MRTPSAKPILPDQLQAGGYLELPLEIPDVRRRAKEKRRAVRVAIYFAGEHAWPVMIREVDSSQ
ncbi:MAG: hypothetical protein KJ070_25060 [Verrucomicrobia bacterium]|nr:hypothetical protein [Verrucomicrobiota bacterium]